MAEAELIEQLRAQVMSLKTPRNTTPERGTTDTTSSGSSSRGRITALTSAMQTSSSTSRSNTRAPSTEPAILDAPIILDIGGVTYRTTQQTLKSVDGSYFAEMADGMTDVLKTSEGHIFIDRNGELFGYILEFLRGSVHRDVETMELPKELSKLKGLRREAMFYRLSELVSRIQEAIQEQERTERMEDDAVSSSSVIVQEEDNTSEKEMDVVFHSIASSQCHFTEDRIQELMGRVNYALSIKQADGFKIKSSSSDVIFDKSKDPAFVLFMHVTLIRDKRKGTPSIFSSTAQIRPPPAAQQLYHSSSFPQTHPSFDPAAMDGAEMVGTPRSRRVGTAFSPPPEPSYAPGRYGSHNGLDIVPESVFASLEYRPDGHRHLRSNYRPRYTNSPEWDYSPDQQPSSPRGAGHYQPSLSTLQRKNSGRLPPPRQLDAPAARYEGEDGGNRGYRRDAWVNYTPSC